MTGLRWLWETLKQIRYSRPRPKFCPKCRSHNIYPASMLGILPTTYRCQDCGYEGILVLEVDQGAGRPADPSRAGSETGEREGGDLTGL